MMVDVARIAKITRLLYERQQFAYLMVDREWLVLEASANLSRYGFLELTPGLDARERIDFLVGLDVRTTLDLPIVMSPSGFPVHVVLLPEEEGSTIVLMDASREYEQQQLVQQKANENELLLVQQRRLTEDLRATQDALVQKNKELQEASRLQSGFLSGASHEFRTPLASMLGYTDLLAERLVSQSLEESQAQIHIVRRSARHLLSLVENLLDHGKLEAEELVLNSIPVDLQELSEEISDILMPLATSKEIELNILRCPERLPTCLVDSSRLRQILLNIVGNAIKFTDQGGVDINFACHGDCLHLEVIDTGIGISVDDLQHVRRPFWQAEKSDRAGTGLGLTITERVVEMLGGELEIDSTLSSGTRVNIQIPAPIVTAAEAAELKEFVPQISGRRFLLAEDDLDIAGLLVLLLGEQGIEVVHVENGTRAVQAAEKSHFDLILMDLQMPVMDGYKATEILRSKQISTPVLVMTASAIESDRGRAEKAGCDGYLLKPVAIDEVLMLADELIKTKTGR